ncbi:MAG: 2-hydroxyacyl-CoA dehydratase family protein [Thermoplasmatota archaeon]
MQRIGISTTVPIEPFLAAGVSAVDLNNLFVTNADPAGLVEDAQVIGFPRNICTWIKGMYGPASNMDGVVGVVRGDCSNTDSLLETLKRDGIRTHPFSYPIDRNRDDIEEEISSLCGFLGTDMKEADMASGEVERLRSLARRVDLERSERLGISAREAHLVQVSSSDFNSDPGGWEDWAKSILSAGREREAPDPGPRIGYIGVPPIITDLFSRMDSLGGHVVFFETQRQFTMPFPEKDWIGKYLEYTYPYSIDGRIEDIREQVVMRDIDGIIHYVQSFCHRQIDDIIFRKELDLPILTIEGNLPGPMDERTVIRIEAFLDILEGLP